MFSLTNTVVFFLEKGVSASDEYVSVCLCV